MSAYGSIWKHGDDTGMTCAEGKPLCIGDRVVFASGGKVWIVGDVGLGGVDLHGGKRRKFSVKGNRLYRARKVEKIDGVYHSRPEK